jgi:hypothetical protein
MNKLFFSTLLLTLFFYSNAQTVKVNQQKEKVKSESIDVYATTLEGKENEISSAWVKFLKSMGKLKQNNEPMLISEPVINGTSYSGKPVYADTKKVNENSSTVWMGINATEWGDNYSKANGQLEKLVYQFGVKFYRDQAQAQIDETQQAIDAVEKQIQKMSGQNKDLNIKLSNNEQEKIQLEKNLEVNKLENASLKIKIENNNKAQDSLANVSIQIKKVLEQQKEKQRKIN